MCVFFIVGQFSFDLFNAASHAALRSENAGIESPGYISYIATSHTGRYSMYIVQYTAIGLKGGGGPGRLGPTGKICDPFLKCFMLICNAIYDQKLFLCNPQ